MFDIDRVFDVVRSRVPLIRIGQHWGTWPADDEGLWFFDLPTAAGNIQLESGTGMCPFFVEHDGMKSPAEGGGWHAATVAEAARMVVDYLTACQSGHDSRADE